MARRQVSAPAAEPRQQPPTRETSRRAIIGICFGLAMLVLAVFGQTLRHEFVNYDDYDYVFGNPAVTDGMSFEGIGGAFTHVHASNWHPVTWMSHMLDCQLYGLWPGGHHLTNVLIHAATAILLFLLLRNMTGSPWRSAFVAAFFAIHPLRVESVAWVSERKDLLAGLFFMLTLFAYARYIRSFQFLASGSYWLVLLFFALGLMSKPMLVTLPFVLLLLDYWPLRRLPGGELPNAPRLARGLEPAETAKWKMLIVEKLPLFLISAVSCVVTVLAQRDAAVDWLPAIERASNAAIAYWTYLRQTLWPSGLAAYYPYQMASLPGSAAVLPGLVLAGVCAAVFLLRRRHPYLVIGWLWFLGMLVPVIGFMQVGAQAHADRYTYLPQIGILIAMVWGVADLAARRRRLACAGAAAMLVAILAGIAWVQTSYWRDSATLWSRTLGVTSRNSFAECSLGHALSLQGKNSEAIAHYQRALEITPDYWEVHNNLGNLLASEGRNVEAIDHFRRALRIDSALVKTHDNLGLALQSLGKSMEAIEHFRHAVRLEPDYAGLRVHLGDALAAQGDFDEAIEQYRRALEINPGDANVHGSLGAALQAQARYPEAIANHTKALDLAPESPAALNNLAWILATCSEATIRNGPKAVELARKAVTLVGDGHASFLDTLAAAYAEAGRFPEAVDTARRALDLAVKSGDATMAQAIRKRLELYEAGVPYREKTQNR